MDDTTRRQSGIPRPVSRLPVPRPSGLPKPTPPVARSNSTVRPKASRDSIISNSSVGEASRTTLRASASRDQLRPASRASVTDGRNARIRASASHDQLRSPAKPRSRPTTSTSTTNRGLMTPSKRNSVVPAVSPQRAAPKPEDEASPFETSPGFPGGSLTPPGQPMQSLDVSPLQERLESLDIEGSRADECAVDSSAPAETPKSRSSKPRPSLSERTMETLARIPSSPAMNKRPSSFFDANGRARSRAGSTSSRPGSSHASEGSRRTSFSRPGSSSHDEGLTTGRVTSNTFKTRLSTIDGTPGGGSTPVSAAKSPGIRKSASRSSLTTGSRAHEATSPSDKRSRGAPSKPASKSMAARPPKTRAPVGGLSKKASLPAINLAAADDDESQSRGAWDGSIPSAGPKKSLAANEPEGATSPSARKSSSALRDQIAKAKAAKRAAMQADIASQAAGPEQTPIVPSDSGFDFGVEHDDPFNTRKGDDPSKKILSQRVGAARTTGRLNIAALGLKEIPVEVMKMYDLESMTAQDGSWAESVDLTRLVAADNELEHLDDSIFPDSSPESMGDSESEQGNIFGGLETIDLHGNLLANVPLGFRRLSNLTSLNLSSNRLQNNSIDAIAQMTALRDLKLAKNLFFGPMSWELSNLTNLEILDLHGNNISAMPRNVDQMSRLRILNLNENSLEMLPFESLSKMPLTELLVKKNKLSGALIRDSIECLPQLQTLDASLNQLTGLVPLGATIDLPALSILTLSINRLQGLPDMTTWTSLLTLAVDENSISSIPNSFFGLEKLRHADFSGNDIRVVPPEVARMDSLSMIRLNGNPLRDKKFVSITTEELKDHLAARLEPPPPYQEDGEVEALPAFLGADKVVEVTPEARTQDGDDQGDSDYDDFATPPTSRPHSQSRSRSQTVSSLRSRSYTLSNQVWPVKQGGLLDRSRTESSSLNSVIASKVAAEHQVKEMQLHNNLFASIPSSLSFFAATLSALNMAHNELIGETYLTEAIELPALKDLSLMTNRITGLDPLVKYLRAPMLEKLDVSINRLNALPKSLKETFPKLMVLNLSGNQVSELEPDSIKGLKIVDASSNEIARLDPRIGLLGGPGGLERFDVMGNRFKVPRWNILESGTQALLQWLRSRVSAAEMTAWREANGDEDNFDDVD